jgi:hypothetical protein
MQQKTFFRTMFSISLVALLILALAIPAVQAQEKFPNRGCGRFLGLLKLLCQDLAYTPMD